LDNQRNLILAVVLCAALLLGWDVVMSRLYPEQDVITPVTEVASRADTPAERAAIAAAAQGAPMSAAGQPLDIETALAAEGRVPIRASEIVGSLNPVGARVDDIDLTTHRQTVEKNSGPIRLFAPAGTPVEQYAQFGWVGEGVAVPDASTVWEVEGEALTEATPLTMRWDNGAGQMFVLTFSVDDHYMLTVRQEVTNSGEGAVGLRPYALVSRTSATASPSTFTVHSGPIAEGGDSVNFDWDYDEIEEDGPVTLEGNTDWIGFTDIYWMSAVIGEQGVPATGAFRATGADTYRADLLYEPVVVNAGDTLTRSTRLFAGAKESAVLDDYEDAGVPKFGLAIDWGWFRFIAWPLWQVLILLFDLVGNFGVAIICLTVIVRGLMFPVAQKQFASMAQMRAVQPKMKALQERYKDDKPQLQQEMAKLYKEEKVNPLAGCLPIFLQIPIFFGLYKALLLAIEMRHQPFVLWIRDLSAPDPLHFLNLFGLLDFTPPGFLAIGPLAVVLGLTMWLQFKLNPAAMDPMQQQIFMIMPWVLMFVMAPFAAGLLIYWITSNLLTLAQQRFLYSRHPQLRAQAEKEAADRARAAERDKSGTTE